MGNVDFLIPLNGLSAGKTVYRWTAGKEFFDGFENTEILDASLDIETEVEKSGQYIGIDCHISGSITVECDRCLGELEIPVETDGHFSVKFGTGSDGSQSTDDGREIVFISAEDSEMDMSQIVYDYACLALPMQRVHEEGGCDPEVTAHLGYHGIPEEHEEKENPFAALKDIFRS